MTEKSLTIIRPDDWHLHVRDGAMLETVVPFSAAVYGRAIIMPNLVPPVTTTDQASGYRDRILEAAGDAAFEPLMTLYLTDDTSPEEIERAHASGFVHGVKLYPAGATTNSASGVTDVRRADRALAAMQACGMPLLVHGEVDNNSGTFPMQSQRLFQAIKGNGGTARLVMLPAESHGYRARESVLHTQAEMIDWLGRHVKDAPGE